MMKFYLHFLLYLFLHNIKGLLLRQSLKGEGMKKNLSIYQIDFST